MAGKDGLAVGKYLPKFCDFCQCSDGVPPPSVAVVALAVYSGIPDGTPTSCRTPTCVCCVRGTRTVRVHTPSVLAKWDAILTQWDRSPLPHRFGHQLTDAPCGWDSAEDGCPGPVLHGEWLLTGVNLGHAYLFDDAGLSPAVRLGG